MIIMIIMIIIMICIPDDESSPLLRPEEPSPPTVQIEQEEVALFGRKHHEPGTPLREFLRAVNPINMEGWSEMRIYAKVYEIFKARFLFFVFVFLLREKTHLKDFQLFLILKKLCYVMKNILCHNY